MLGMNIMAYVGLNINKFHCSELTLNWSCTWWEIFFFFQNYIVKDICEVFFFFKLQLRRSLLGLMLSLNINANVFSHIPKS